MGLLRWLRSLASPGSSPSFGSQKIYEFAIELTPAEAGPAVAPAPPIEAPTPAVAAPTPAADETFMPKFNGRDICDWIDDVNKLKRTGKLPEALELAQGCMGAMTAAARENSSSVMEFYVKQVAIIQRKQKDYSGEVDTIEAWLALEFVPPREDYRLDLQKRLAKAHELLAKERGEDPSEYHAEWKRLVELEKSRKAEHKATTSAPSTGKTAASSEPPRRRTRKRTGPVAPPEVLASPSFVAVDFETANKQGGASACKTALVKFVDGKVVRRESTLIKPPPGYDKFEFTHLHGISKRKVRNAPMWPNLETWVSEFHAGLPVFAHNSEFDLKVWRDLDSFYGIKTAPEHMFCTYKTARKLVPGLKNYKLPTVTKALVPGFRLMHHQSESDAEACGRIVMALRPAQ